MSKIEVYKIESNVKVPTRAFPPLNLLEVDDSIQFSLDKRRSVQTVASKLKREQGKEFTVKKIDNTTARIWRTK